MSYPQRCHASTTTTILYKKIKEQPKAKSRGKRRPNGFSKKTDVPGCLEPGHVQTRDCSSEIGAPVFKKFRIGSRAMAVCTKTHEDKTSSRPRRNAVERALFHNGLCTGRGRLQENAACQADASGCARGSVRPFKKNSTPCCQPARGLRIQIRSSRSSPGKGNHEK